MAQSRDEIQRRSDQKRGVKLCSFKLKLDTIAQLEQLAKAQGISKTAVLEQLIHAQSPK